MTTSSQDQFAPLSAEPDSTTLWQDRYILATIHEQVMAFPSAWVGEILVIERSRILNLPFYDPAVLGVIHHRGAIIPLISLPTQESSRTPIAVQRYTTQETFSIVRLNASVESLPGVGLVVEKVLGSTLSTQRSGDSSTLPPLDQALRIFCPADIPASIWQTQRTLRAL